MQKNIMPKLECNSLAPFLHSFGGGGGGRSTGFLTPSDLYNCSVQQKDVVLGGGVMSQKHIA